MNRIAELRQKAGLSQSQFGKEIGAAQNTISNWENGNRTPDFEILKTLSEYFNCSIEYIMGKSENPNPPSNEEELQFKNIFPIKTKKFPLLGEIACGEPIFANEDRESYVIANADIQADFCLKAKGDSMINARILDGDIVFIRKQPMVENGEIAAVIIDDEATLKRVFYYPKESKLILNPENSKYPPLVYIGEELDHIRILGKAIAFQSDII